MTSLSDSADTIVLFFITFIFAAIIAFYRNVIFQAFNKNLYKNYINFFNTLPLSIYFSNFFSNFNKLIFFLVDQFNSFFKKKK